MAKDLEANVLRLPKWTFNVLASVLKKLMLYGDVRIFSIFLR